MTNHDSDQVLRDAVDTSQRAAQMARVALIIACMGIALSVLGIFLPI